MSRTARSEPPFSGVAPRPWVLCALLILGLAGCGPGTVAVIVAASLATSSGGGGGGGDRAPVLESALYEDVNANGQVDGPDVLTLTFSGDVSLAGAPGAAAVLDLSPPGGWGLGVMGPDLTPEEITVEDLEGAVLQPNGLFPLDAGASGVNLRAGQTALSRPGGAPIDPGATAVEIAGELAPRVVSASITDANSSCLLDVGDTVTVRFTVAVDATSPVPSQVFQLPVTGDSFGTGAGFQGGGAPTGVDTLVILLGSGPVLSAPGLFSPGAVAPGSPSGLDVLAAGTVVDSAYPSVPGRPLSPLGVDVTGPAFSGGSLSGAFYDDADLDGLVTIPDAIVVTFCEDVVVLGSPLAEAVFDLDPTGTFGATAWVSAGSASNEVVIRRPEGGTFQPNGVYGLDSGSSGINVLSGQTGLEDALGSPVQPSPAFVDVDGELNPRVVSVTYLNENGNCTVDAGDHVEVTFTTAVTVLTPDPAVAFQLPVAGDSFGSGAQFLGGIPTDSTTCTVVLGSTPVLKPILDFDPSNLVPGAPSGLDVSPGGEIQDALYATVAASPATPPGLDVGGEVSRAWFSLGDEQDGARFGEVVSPAGDVNGDGYGDIIVSASEYDSAAAVEAGRVYAFHGGPGGLGTAPSWTSSGEDFFDGDFGEELALAGDVNGDGYSDIIVGIRTYSTPETNAGKAYVYHGGGAGLEATPSWTSQGEMQWYGGFGSSACGAGDVNNDGYDDIIVGQHGYDSTQADAGKAYVYFGSPSGLSLVAGWESVGDDVQNGVFGSSVAGAGDVNADGFADVLVGAARSNLGSGGTVFLYYGSPAGPSTTPAWVSIGDGQSSEGFGCDMACAGDVNADGYSDVLIGAYLHDAPMTGGDNGKLYVYHGGPGGLSSTEDWSSFGDGEDGAYLGYAVASAGDVNQDGYSDIVAGAPERRVGGEEVGRAYVFLGGPAGLAAEPVWTSMGDVQPYAGYAETVGSSGDTDGDGRDEVIVGAWNFSSPLGFVGKVYLYCGMEP